MVAGRGRRCAGAAAAALLTVIAAGAVPHAVDASRDSAIVLSGYQTGVAVDSSGGSDSQTISINLEPDTPPFPQKITLDVPKGYTLDLSAKPGAVIGLASITIFGVDTPSLATGLGTLVAKDAKGSATDPEVQACAQGAHAAVWSLSTAIAGQKVDLTILVDVGTEPDVAYVMSACPTGLETTNSSLAASITLTAIEGLVSPTAPGNYRWRALVAPRTRKPYELRALVPLPESVTLNTTYNTRRKTATLRGTVIEGGSAVARVPLTLSGSRDDNDFNFLETRTDTQGHFAVTVPVPRTTDFTVDVAPSTGPCTGDSAAPAGCLGSTTIPPDDAFATVWVSVPGGAIRRIRKPDQRLAEGEGLRPSDVPSDFETSLAGGDRCLNQKGESSLTITGESTSAGFYKIANRADTPTIEEAFGVSRVYATPRQAGRAFDHEARISTIRCEDKGGTNPARITPRKIAAPARVRAFRAVFTFDEIDATVNYDVVFLQRGRSVTILTFVFFNAGDDLERSVTSALAKRMR
jgi:hypothetical protein